MILNYSPLLSSKLDMYECAFYINQCFAMLPYAKDKDRKRPSCFEYYNNPLDSKGELRQPLSVQALENAIRKCNLKSIWKVVATPQGVIVAFSKKQEAENIFEKIDIKNVLGCAVQVAPLPLQCQYHQQMVHSKYSTQHTKNSCDECDYIQNRYVNLCGKCPSTVMNQDVSGHSRYMLIRNVPWSIPISDIVCALKLQGIQVSSIKRFRQHVRIEVTNSLQHGLLQAEGLNFFDVSRFCVSPDRSSEDHTSEEEVLQCFRCQGFWHVASNCRNIPRCVRCGESHTVENCTRPRNNPICCNCSAPHHAAYKGCPIRKIMSQSIPMFFVLSRYTPYQSSAPLTPNLYSKEPRCLL